MFNRLTTKKWNVNNMAMRSQIYEWTNLAPGGTGSTLFRRSGDTSVAVATGATVSIFVGGTGYNITKPAETTATQFVVIEDVACTPDNEAGTDGNNGGYTQIRINTTNYFQNPDVTQQDGIPGLASPYPRGVNNFLKTFDLYPDIYVLPGQVYDVLYTQGSQTLATGTPADVVGVFLKYTLYDGPDALIANKLLELGITVNPNNVDWYKRTLIEQQSAAVMGGSA
jgi:hypothetical protein